MCVCSMCAVCVVCAGERLESSTSSMTAPSISRYMRLSTAEYRELPRCVLESGNCSRRTVKIRKELDAP